MQSFGRSNCSLQSFTPGVLITPCVVSCVILDQLFRNKRFPSSKRPSGSESVEIFTIACPIVECIAKMSVFRGNSAKIAQSEENVKIHSKRHETKTFIVPVLFLSSSAFELE